MLLIANRFSITYTISIFYTDCLIFATPAVDTIYAIYASYIMNF